MVTETEMKAVEPRGRARGFAEPISELIGREAELSDVIATPRRVLPTPPSLD
jgi:hypothetical protein